MQYRPEIDILRALSIIPVILFHAGFEWFKGGYVGVDIFFVISGYLITSIIIQDIQADRFSFQHFYERRIRRILPALYSVIFITTIFAIFILLPDDLVRYSKSLVSVPIFLSNFFFWSERGYFGAASELQPLIHTWSLAIEEQFYIFFPILMFLFFSKFKRYLILFCCFVLLVSLTTSYIITDIHFDTAFYLPFTRCWEIIMGCMLAFYINHRHNTKINHIINTPICKNILCLLGFSFIIYAFIMFDERTPFPSLWALIPTLGAAMIIIGTENNMAVKKIICLKPLIFIGLISYSWYLIHQPIFALARYKQIFDDYHIYWIILSFLLAVISYYIVEQFFRHHKNISQRYIFYSAFGGGLLIIMLGGTIIYKNGFIDNYTIDDQKIFQQFINAPSYNAKEFDRLKYGDFDQNKKKILLIGDSYAKDFINIIKESELADKFSFSTRQINSECGNLFLDDDKIIEPFISTSRLERCRVMGRYSGKKFTELAYQSDEIWLVNDWKLWVIPFLPQSIEKIQSTFNKTVRVFGTKNFGDINKKKNIIY